MGVVSELSSDQRHEVATWIEANSASLPESVRTFLAIHRPYLVAEGPSASKALDAALRELRRALHLTPSSEKRRRSGSPLADLPKVDAVSGGSEREALEAELVRAYKLTDWHRELKKRHNAQAKRLKERLAKMPIEETETNDTTRLEDIELPPEDPAVAKAAQDSIVAHLLQGNGPDPAMESVNETLMPGGAVLVREEYVPLPAKIPDELADAREIKTLHDLRVRYDFSVAVTRIELDVEKKIIEDQHGERHVIAPSTTEYGPPRYSVTWSALATLAVLVGQFAMPLNRIATLLSTPEKRFGAGGLRRMLHYVAERLVPIYLELANQLANCEVLAGDDTSCRVIEVTKYFAESAAASKKPPPPWTDYQTPAASEAELRRCEQAQKERVRRRDEGDRTATRTPEDTPSLGVLIGRKLVFESARKSGDGAKQAMHISVVSGRSVAADPRSLIVFYRSHLGSSGNLFESLLRHRETRLKKVVLQGDMSTTNLVSAPELLMRFEIHATGCTAHARRPFAIYKDEDVALCEYMLHLFLGLALHEQHLDRIGRNRDNVLAVRGCESREMWGDILELAKEMANKWSKATKLGTAARYIIKHFGALTAYLDDPRLEPTNNLRERMLRMEKLIEGSSMFRRTLEGRFGLDIVRTILQTAVAAGVPVHEYLVSVLRASDEEISANPARFTPRAWAESNSKAGAPAQSPP
jgi:hypothetical protein